MCLLSKGLRESFESDRPFDHSQVSAQGPQFIEMHMKQPDWRDMVTLARKAKDGFFRKQLNWHSVGPDGVKSTVLTRGKDIGKREFDQFRKHLGQDVFVLDTYENGTLVSNQVTKDMWYCFFDIHVCEDRKAQPMRRPLAAINMESQRLARDYLLRLGQTPSA
jgi:hypothetical protein